MPWRIDFEGEVYREGDLTLAQIAKIERLLDYRSWLHIQPIRYAGDGIVILAVMHAERSGIPVADLLVKIGEMKPDQYLGLIKLEDDDDLPTEFRDGFPPTADEPSTGT